MRNLPEGTRADMEARYQEYKKLIENEFEMPDDCTTLPMSIHPPVVTIPREKIQSKENV